MQVEGEQDNELLNAALLYAGKGWPVLPVHPVKDGTCTCSSATCSAPGKHPYTAHGVKDASTVEAVIRQWWTRWPEANVGIATGKASGTVVLDVDPRHGGNDTLFKWEEQSGALPETVESVTGGQGRHIAFAYPEGVEVIRSRSFLGGLDVKADGGYIVAPPSRHLSGRTYQWEASHHPDDIGLAQVPSWLLQAILEAAPLTYQDGVGTQRIPVGQRDNALMSIAGSMRRFGLSQEGIESVLLQVNDHGLDTALEPSQVKKIAASAGRYPAGSSQPSRPISVTTMSASPPASLADVQALLFRHFPDLWPAIDLGLATCATLLLADNANPAAVIYVGPPGTGKTTVATMFDDVTANGQEFCYRTDKFTPAAFVSHSARATRDQLSSIDLLPRIQHKVMVTPELAGLFRGKEDDLAERFAVITRVLDGQGLMTDSGTHGQRGYKGDYLFAWLGCTTPLEEKVWRVMAQLGSRLYFCRLTPNGHHTARPYRIALQECQTAVQGFLAGLVTRHKVRGVHWPSQEEAEIRGRITKASQLLAVMRTMCLHGLDYQPMPEDPRRAEAVLYNLARAHAIVHGRMALTADDVSLVGQVVLSSMPHHRSQLLIALLTSPAQGITIHTAKAAVGVRSDETAKKLMADLEWLGLIERHGDRAGPAPTFMLRPSWRYLMEPEYQTMLGLDRPPPHKLGDEITTL